MKEPEYISKIKLHLQRCNFTQGDLATVMDRPQQAISEILNLKKRITPTTAKELDAALDIPAKWILDKQTEFELDNAKVFWLPIRERSRDLQIAKQELRP